MKKKKDKERYEVPRRACRIVFTSEDFGEDFGARRAKFE